MLLNICNEQDSPHKQELFSPQCQIVSRLRNPGRKEHKMIGNGSSNETLLTNMINVVEKCEMEMNVTYKNLSAWLV